MIYPNALKPKYPIRSFIFITDNKENNSSKKHHLKKYLNPTTFNDFHYMDQRV